MPYNKGVNNYGVINSLHRTKFSKDVMCKKQFFWPKEAPSQKLSEIMENKISISTPKIQQYN